ncbi:hypothetical protein [Peribacillus simplex]|uniref:hypothetical protein n=1 Tax=Peribacillus simplex TaxID=1478 RepID=UPI003D2DA41A
MKNNDVTNNKMKAILQKSGLWGKSMTYHSPAGLDFVRIDKFFYKFVFKNHDDYVYNEFYRKVTENKSSVEDLEATLSSFLSMISCGGNKIFGDEVK